MKEPIQNTSAEIENKSIKEIKEPFITALKNRRYEILFFTERKTHAFYCSDYDLKEFIENATCFTGKPSGEWMFTDVIMDTSKRDPEGHPTLIRMTYHPQISLVNVPFMVLPAAGENSGEHIPENITTRYEQTPSDEDLKHEAES